MVRRLKHDVRDAVGEFPLRRVVQVDIDGLADDAPELALARLLDEYRQVREALVADAPGADDERAELPEAQVQAELDAQIELASAAFDDVPVQDAASLRARARELLDRMADIAEAARYPADPRVEWFLAWVREHLLDGRSWRDRRVLVFTEYADTKRYLEQRLREALADTDDAERRVATFHGGVDDEAREAIKRSFNADPARDPLRILVATDAAREGVNLQNHCADLFHFDVPWNPSRMEQRNGRIDRKLQRAPEVRCHYFVFAQRPEDRVLAALVSKTDTIQRELGSLSQVIEHRLTTTLEGGIRQRSARDLAQRIASLDTAAAQRAVVDEELEAVRERREALSKNLDQLRDILTESEKAIGLDPAALRHALDASLAILGAPGLQCLDAAKAIDDPARVRWAFPALDTRHGADASWADTFDTLRAPRARDEKLWEWRRRAPIRPVTFADAGSLDADTVHLHLEHRVVQRLLGRFASPGFVHDDLSRATVVRTESAIPRVVVLGRLSLYGDGASRLHDEVVACTARWTDPDGRSEKLKPYAEDARAETLRLLERALSSPALHDVPDAIRARLAASVERDVGELLLALQARAMGLAEGFTHKLRERGVREAKALEEVLQAQKKRIAAMVAEREQLVADLRHWKKRLAAIDREIVEEPARIRASYEVRTPHLVPLGVVYLWPVTG